MKRLLVSFLVIVLLAVSSAQAQSIVLPAFPGVEGFGAQAVGGRGGTVYIVTNTNDSGAGSLRQCVEASGARTCVFEVGGLISLASTLRISNPYLTIAGQTAPGGGITLKLGGATEAISIQTSQVIIRYISVRPGPGGANHGIQIAQNGTELNNIVIDHVSLSWGVDSVIETWYRAKDVTFSWLIVSEALDDSTHPKGAHSKGLMVGGYKGSESGGAGSVNISVLNTLMAHNADRNPLMQMCGPAQVINNVTYDPMYTFSHQQLNCVSGYSYVNWINNYHKKGPSSTSTSDLKFLPSDDGACGQGKAYMSGNRGNASTGVWSYGFSGSCSGRTDIVVSVPVAAPTVVTTNAQDAYNNVLASAGNSQAIGCDGNWYARRDSIDARIISEVQAGTGKVIDDPSQVGGWVTPATGSACGDTDRDGIPNAWEVSHGLNPNLKADGNSVSPSGYTWLEEYFNGTGGVILPPTNTPTATAIVSPTLTPTPTLTLVPTATRTPTPTRTQTAIPTWTFTPIPPTVTRTPSATWTPSAIPSATWTPIPSATWTPVPSSTWTPSLTPSATFTFTPVPSETPVPTFTPTITPTPGPSLICVRVTRLIGVKMRPAPSLLSDGYPGAIGLNARFPVIRILTNSEGLWAQINEWIYIPLKIGSTVFAVRAACP